MFGFLARKRSPDERHPGLVVPPPPIVLLMRATCSVNNIGAVILNGGYSAFNTAAPSGFSA